MRSAPLLLIAVLLGGGIPRAYADIYAYTDTAGGLHYSNVPSDQRYVRVMSEPREPPRRRPGVSAEPADWRRRAAVYSGLIDDAARRAKVQPALLCAVIAVESAFDPNAISIKGAQGLMQLRPGTARRYGVQRPFDPAENLRGGARYLGDLLNRYGNDMELALAAYNAGEDAVDRHGRTIPPFAETRAYVPAVLRLYRKFLSDGVHLAWYPKTLPPST
jgi:soluble lytic murein transglycosylase-like protein